MARNPSIVYQVLQRIDQLKRFGESKHEAKQEEKARALAAGEKWNPSRVDGIFSHKTAEVYKEHGVAFVKWARATYGVKTLEAARPFVKAWLEKSIADGKSAWTVRLQAAALAKIYGVRSTDFGVQLPRREREDIQRSRHPRAMDKKFSEARNRALVAFARATGLRRVELRAVTWRDVYWDPSGRLKVHVERGKGGKPREVTVLRAYEKEVWALREATREKDSQGPGRLFERIPSRMDVHGYRREYAAARYREVRESVGKKEFTHRGELYIRKDGTVFDREALREVSRDLGHQRVEVVARHYLD